MSAYAHRPGRLPIAALAFGVLALCAAVFAQTAVLPAAVVVVGIALLAAGYRTLTRWDALVAAVVLVILFVPIKRYRFAGVELPFEFEPYRVAVAILVAVWLSSLLIDRRVRLCRGGLEGPFLALWFAVLGSILTNVVGITDLRLGGNVTKELLFLLSFFLVFYVVASVIRGPEKIHRVLKILVGGAAVVAVFAIVERRTSYNVFDHLGSVFPILEFEGALDERGIARGGRLRTYASAQHPIALGAMLAIVAPLAFYLFSTTRSIRWGIALVLVVFGALSTISRTSVIMLLVSALIVLWLRPGWIKKTLPFVLPALVAVHFAMPGVIGSIRGAFFPQEGLVAQQEKNRGRLSEDRLGPQFEIIRDQPLFGQGYGTRITTGPEKNALILDNQWLATAVEIGLVGLLAWIWVFMRFVRRAAHEARRDGSPRGMLLTALTASVAGFALGLFTYDAFSFVQVTFVLFILLAIGAATLAEPIG